MPKNSRVLGLGAALLVPTEPASDVARASESPSVELPRARDGNIAVAEELEAARRTGTVEAYDMFIARHPNHPLAETARREREHIVRGKR